MHSWQSVHLCYNNGLTGPYSETQWWCQCSALCSWLSHRTCSSGLHWYDTGRLELISGIIVSCAQDERLPQWADFDKHCLYTKWHRRSNSNFAIKHNPCRCHVCKICEIGGKKMGSNMWCKSYLLKKTNGLAVSIYTFLWEFHGLF